MSSSAPLDRYAICPKGYVARITREERGVFYGVGITGEVWQTADPRFIAPEHVKFALSNRYIR